jgi:phosphoglycerate dehydrogenase-like enzyme
MSYDRTVVVLDGLFDTLDLEQAIAAERGWSVVPWDGSEAMLRAAKVVVHVRTKIDRFMLDKLSACRVIGRFGTGLDTIDLAAAAERGLRVVGVRDYCIPELTSQTLGLAFGLDRRLDAVRSNRLAADASWQEVAARQPMPGRATATVIGFGSMGAAVTRALLAVGLSVSVVTQHGAQEARDAGASPVPLDVGLARGGFVFLHAALNKETAGMIGRAQLELIPSGTILINTARIGLMDEAAVASALRGNNLSGLGLDAKLMPDSPLRAFLHDERVLVTPHIGWYSDRSALELRRRTIRDSILAFVNQDELGRSTAQGDFHE